MIPEKGDHFQLNEKTYIVREIEYLGRGESRNQFMVKLEVEAEGMDI